jgi:pyocin large subunit-like protein
MHNWPDTECAKILSNTASAMAPDSRLLIAEMVVPELTNTGDNTVYWMDLAMLVIGGRERSEKDFRALLDSAGLELINIWRSPDGPQCVLETKLKDSAA